MALSFHRHVPKETCGGYDAGAHLFPFRTEKLSPAVPMILHPCGKVGRRPPIQESPPRKREGFFDLRGPGLTNRTPGPLPPAPSPVERGRVLPLGLFYRDLTPNGVAPSKF